MKKIAVFPGSFDPITTGHVDILERALPLFDEIIIAIGVNSKKKYLFSLDQRLQFIQTLFEQENKITVDTYKGLTVEYCKRQKAHYLLRGVRSITDFEFEKTIAQLNKTLWHEVETICLICQPAYSHISSSIVREILINGGDPSPFVPHEIIEQLIINS